MHGNEHPAGAWPSGARLAQVCSLGTSLSALGPSLPAATTNSVLGASAIACFSSWEGAKSASEALTIRAPFLAA